MLVLLIYKFDKDQKNEIRKLLIGQHFFQRSWASNSEAKISYLAQIRFHPRFYASADYEAQIEMAEKTWRHCFPHYNHMGIFPVLKGM